MWTVAQPDFHLPVKNSFQLVWTWWREKVPESKRTRGWVQLRLMVDKGKRKKEKTLLSGTNTGKIWFFLTWKNETTPIINWPFFKTLVEIVLWLWPECWFLVGNLEVVAFIIMSAFSRTSQRVRHRCPLRAEIRSWTISGSVRDIKAGWTFDLWPWTFERPEPTWTKSGHGCCVGFHGDDTQRHASWVRVVIWSQRAAGWARVDVFLSQSSEAKMVPESGGKNKRLHSFGPLSPLSSMWDVLKVSSC